MRDFYFKMSKRWTTLLLVVGFSFTALAQMESRLTYRRYTTQDGLPQMQTERIWQDSRGYIYIGTLSGFVRFDGHDFTPFLKGRRENIVGFTEVGGVRALGFRRQWLTNQTDVEMKPIDPEGHWLLNNFNAGSLPEGFILLEDEREKNRRLCQVTDDDFLPVLKGGLLDLMTPDRKLAIDSTDIYVPTERGLYRVVDRKRAIRLTAKDDFFTLLRTSKGLLAFAADGIYQIETHGISRVMAYSFASPDYGVIVRRLANGHLVIADSHTIYEYDGQGIQTVASGFNMIKDMMVDRWDRLWLATYEGAFCFFNRCFTTHRLSDENDIVRDVAICGNDQLVLGTLNGKVMAGDKVISNQGSYFNPSAVTLGDKVYLAGATDVLQYDDGSTNWLGVSQERIQFVGKAQGLLIIGSRHRVSSYSPATGRLDTLTTDIAHPWCAQVDNGGTLWVGSSYGLYSIPKGGKATKADHPQKLVVTTMTRDTRGNILFASADSIFLIRNSRVEAMTSRIPQLAGHEVRSLHISPRGFFVIAVIDGLFVCRISSDYQLSDIHFYDHTNGFTVLEPQKAVMAETAEGTVWLPGVEEMVSFNPERLLNFHQEDTYIAPPLRWWQLWWVWLIALPILSLAVWRTTRIYEVRKSRKTIRHLLGKKLENERQIRAIRDKAIKAETSQLAKDIVKITEKAPSTRMTITTSKGTVMLDAIDIAYFKADGNYTTMVSFQGEDTIFLGLGRLEKMLDQSTFVRADRSTIVNIHSISRLDPRERLCTFRSAEGIEVETTLLLPAFKRLKEILF